MTNVDDSNPKAPTVVNFTDARQRPTLLDKQQLAEFPERHGMAKAGEIHSFGIVCGPLTEASLLPGANELELTVWREVL